MDPIHIHNLLRQLTSEVKCPHCKIKVHPNMIRVENSTENYCLLRIRCHICGEVFHGHAHVGIKVSPALEGNIQYQRTISQRPLPPSPPPISEEELSLLGRSLSREAKRVSDFFVHE